MTNLIGLAVAVFFPGILAAVVWWDARRYRIPNALNAALAGLFIVALAGGHVPAGGLWGHLGASVFAFLLGMIFYFQGWTGGGDAKLLAALVLWTGSTADSLRLIVVTALVGGVVSLVVLGLIRWRIFKNPGAPDNSPISDNAEKAKVPYGIALAVAGADFWLRRLMPPILP